ncbi:MAG TPA: YMGG-like glycine zipper-containing protein [Candidatus Acidoferrales bacterium]|nr:YMGG-like glycine zipper-containing protein [Candidatus Acidoferrales bacterium]
MRARTMALGILRVALVCGVALFLAGAAAADTLTLKDGRVIHGRYIGGTADAIQMDVNGAVQTFDVRDVQSLSKDSSQSQPPPPPAQLPNAPLPSGAITVPAAPPGTAPAAPPPDANTVTIPVGTRILVRMLDGVDSEKNHVGDRFRATLQTNIEQDGWLVVRRDTDVYGRLSNVQGAGRLSGHAELKLELTGILIHNNLVPLVTGDYEVAGKGRGGNTAKKAVGGAALGAIIGALAGGGRGAAIGAGAGAAAGATVNIITKGEKVKVPSETLLEFRLDAPLTLTPEAATPR